MILAGRTRHRKVDCKVCRGFWEKLNKRPGCERGMFCEIRAEKELREDEAWVEFQEFLSFILPGAFQGQGQAVNYANINTAMDIYGVETSYKKELLTMINMYLCSLRIGSAERSRILRDG